MMEIIMALQSTVIAWLVWQHFQNLKTHLCALRSAKAGSKVMFNCVTAIAKLQEQTPKPEKTKQEAR